MIDCHAATRRKCNGSAPLLTNNGFTILEVLMTLALVAVIGVGVGFALQAASQRTALDESLSTLRQMAELARGQAIDSGDIATLTVDFDHGLLSIQSLSRQAKLPAGVSVRAVTAKEAGAGPQTAIAFFPDGSSSGAEFHLRSGSSSAKAIVGWLNGRFHDAR